MNFEEYYEHYLSLHQNKWCRRMHVFGQVATILFIAACMFYKTWILLLFSPLIVYPFAWSGHYFFEKNKPAAFKNPLWAKLSDWLMLKDWILGNIER